MSLSAEDREFINRETAAIVTSLIVMMVAAFVLTMTVLQSMDDVAGERYRDLCRAHYPECIVETKP